MKKYTNEQLVKLVDHIREANIPDHRTFEEAEMASHIERIFKNVQRIHGNNGLDWIEIASIRSADFLTKKGYKPE